MSSVINFIIWIIKAISVPAILVLVWFFDFRPFSSVFAKLDEILTVDLAAKVADKNIPPAIYGAIDVALLTFLYNLLMIICSKFFKKPAQIKIEVSDRMSSQQFIAIPFNEEMAGMQSPTHINLKGEIEIIYGKWFFEFIGVRVSVIWDPNWLSIEPQIKGGSELLKLRPGGIDFNFLDMLPESDPSTSIDGKLSVMANSNFKRNGSIGLKLGVNSRYKLIRGCFNWIIPLLVKSELKHCRIMLQKGS
ncbi:hypothetical protein [Sutcliffiella halmapala]|uniref:hypothetical protein n=1 Tax=Sutcliffiella halmapala TaxID=79882 RepID=UPI0009951EF4|nr:hypothetical protein [Sutcliffiella halmapala]